MKKTHGAEIQTTTGLWSVEHSPEDVEKIMKVLEELDDWRLAAIHHVCVSAKSLLLSMYFVLGDLSIDDAYNAARVEEDFQMREWGQVRGPYGHDIDIAFMKMKLAATRCYMNFLEFPEEK